LAMKDEQRAMRNEQLVMKEEQRAMRDEQVAMKEEQRAMRDEQLAMKDEQITMGERLVLMQSQIEENTTLTKAIRDRQEETDAKLENLTFNMHKQQGDVTAIRETVANIKSEIEYTYEKTSRNELEIFKLRKEQVK